MNNRVILIVSGEPNSIFFEIFFKSLKLKKFKNPIILISSKQVLIKQMKYLKFKNKIKLLNPNNLNTSKLDNKSINLINVNYNQSKTFQKISNKSNKFIKASFEMAFKLIKKEKITKFINGPISKKYFLKNKYIGIT